MQPGSRIDLLGEEREQDKEAGGGHGDDDTYQFLGRRVVEDREREKTGDSSKRAQGCS